MIQSSLWDHAWSYYSMVVTSRDFWRPISQARISGSATYWWCGLRLHFSLSLCLSFPHFKMVMMRPALWGSCEHCINHGYQMLRRVIWHLITAQMLAIFITYYNPNFLNKVHLFMAPLNSVPHLNYSIHWNWSCTNSSIFIFPIYPPKKRHWHWWGKAMAISGSNWMSVEPLAWLFLKDNTDFPRLSSTMLV